MKTRIRRRGRWRPWMTDALALVAALGFFIAAVLTPLMARAEPAPSVVEAADAVMGPAGPAGMTVVVYRRDRRLWRLDLGDIEPDAALPVASASKWVAAALVMTAVDEGRITLDAPVGVWLPGASGPGTDATLRQLLSFTAGQGGLLGGADTRQSTRMTLQQSAATIARRPLTDPAGSTFRYGGPSLHWPVPRWRPPQACRGARHFSRGWRARWASPMRAGREPWGGSNRARSPIPTSRPASSSRQKTMAAFSQCWPPEACLTDGRSCRRKPSTL